MNETDQTKVCPMCAEPIRSAAKLCPHCRHAQTTWSFFNPNVSAMLIGIFWLGGILVLALLGKKVAGRQDFERHQGKLSILESTVSQRVASNAVYVVISGILTNGSDYSWKNIGLEGQIFSRDGKLIDVIPAPSDFYGGIVAAAHSTSAFKIESRTSRSPADYANHQVFVRWAKDANAWP